MMVRYIPIVLLLCTACGLLPMVSGCSALQQRVVDAKLERQYQNESRVLQKGQAAFFRKEYQAAWDIFDQISQQATNADVVHAALYGMACSSFAMAQTQKDIQDALGAWEAWYRVSPASFNPLDPRMMDPILKNTDIRQHLEGQLQTLRQQLNVAADEVAGLQSLLQKHSGQMTRLKTQRSDIQSRHAAQLEALNGQITNLVQENKKLRNQIDALHAIDQRIKAKKKEITSQ